MHILNRLSGHPHNTLASHEGPKCYATSQLHHRTVYLWLNQLYKPVVGSYGLITSCSFQSARSSSLALTLSQSCKKVMWGWVIQTDLVTWPSKIGGHYLHIICKKGWRNIQAKAPRRSTPRFSCYLRKPSVGWYPHNHRRVGARANVIEVISVSQYYSFLQTVFWKQ